MSDTTCPTCGAAIPPDAPEGRCPACLLEAGLGDAAPPPELLEALFPQFQVETVVGRGGMGVVYRARQRSLDRLVALKLLPPEIATTPGFADRFRREARTLAQLAHPNIVQVHEAAEADGHYVLAMEYVDGVNLRQAQEGGGLSPEQALAVVPQICDALQYAHDQGVVHRDIKPDNVLLTKDGRVKIADFGLAKLLRNVPGDVSLTGTAQVMGTFHYLAPEQIRSPKDVDHRADLYALGVVFYELLTGELPIGRFPVPSERVKVDVRLDDVVLRALERERDRRYQQADEIKTGIHDATQGDMRHAQPKPAAPATADRNGDMPLHPLAVAGILCLPAALLAGLIVYALGTRDETAMLAGVAVLGTGWILAYLAAREIKRAPSHWRGLGLARTVLWIPVIGVLVFALGALLLLPVPGPGHDVEARRAAIAARLDARKQMVRATVEGWALKIETFGGMTLMEDMAPMLSPEDRLTFLEMPPDTFKERAKDLDLGLVMFPVQELQLPLSQYEVADITFLDENEEQARVTLSRAGESIFFGVHLVNGVWYLELGPVTHVPPPDDGQPPPPVPAGDAR